VTVLEEARDHSAGHLKKTGADNLTFKDYALATRSLLLYKSVIVKAADEPGISSVSRIFNETKQYNTKILLFELQVAKVSKHTKFFKNVTRAHKRQKSGKAKDTW